MPRTGAWTRSRKWRVEWGYDDPDVHWQKTIALAGPLSEVYLTLSPERRTSRVAAVRSRVEAQLAERADALDGVDLGRHRVADRGVASRPDDAEEELVRAVWRPVERSGLRTLDPEASRPGPRRFTRRSPAASSAGATGLEALQVTEIDEQFEQWEVTRRRHREPPRR